MKRRKDFIRMGRDLLREERGTIISSINFFFVCEDLSAFLVKKVLSEIRVKIRSEMEIYFIYILIYFMKLWNLFIFCEIYFIFSPTFRSLNRITSYFKKWEFWVYFAIVYCSWCKLFNDFNIISLLAKLPEQWHWITLLHPMSLIEMKRQNLL